jgi:hypothetical protein
VVVVVVVVVGVRLVGFLCFVCPAVPKLPLKKGRGWGREGKGVKGPCRSSLPVSRFLRGDFTTCAGAGKAMKLNRRNKR